MKRLLILTCAAFLVAGMFVMIQDAGVDAAQPKGTTYRSTVNWELAWDTVHLHYLVDSNTFQDTTTTTEGGNHIFLFSGLEDYSKISGYIYATGASVDSGASAADTLSRSKDTSMFWIWTSWGHPSTSGNIKTKVYSDTLIGGDVNGDTTFFNLTDSTIGDYIYFQFYQIAQDTGTAAVRTSMRAGTEVDINYTATVYMIARP
jgi:hypothetical protein